MLKVGVVVALALASENNLNSFTQASMHVPYLFIDDC